MEEARGGRRGEGGWKMEESHCRVGKRTGAEEGDKSVSRNRLREERLYEYDDDHHYTLSRKDKVLGANRLYSERKRDRNRQTETEADKNTDC